MHIKLTGVPIGSNSHVEMMRQGGTILEKEDWVKAFSSLSKEDVITFELSSTITHPFIGLSRISLQVENVQKTGSNYPATGVTTRIESMRFKFISGEQDRSVGRGTEPSIADALRKNGWMIL